MGAAEYRARSEGGERTCSCRPPHVGAWAMLEVSCACSSAPPAGGRARDRATRYSSRSRSARRSARNGGGIGGAVAADANPQPRGRGHRHVAGTGASASGRRGPRPRVFAPPRGGPGQAVVSSGPMRGSGTVLHRAACDTGGDGLAWAMARARRVPGAAAARDRVRSTWRKPRSTAGSATRYGATAARQASSTGTVVDPLGPARPGQLPVGREVHVVLSVPRPGAAPNQPIEG